MLSDSDWFLRRIKSVSMFDFLMVMKLISLFLLSDKLAFFMDLRWIKGLFFTVLTKRCFFTSNAGF